jgi:hypothetical protein
MQFSLQDPFSFLAPLWTKYEAREQHKLQLPAWIMASYSAFKEFSVGRKKEIENI